MMLTPEQYQLIADCSPDSPTTEALKTLIQGLLDQLDECQNQEARYRQMVDNSPNPVFSVSQDGLILTCNPATRRCFQLDGDLIGLHYTRLVPTSDNPTLPSLVEQVFMGQSFSDVSVVYCGQDGHRRHMSSRLYPVFDRQHHVLECLFANTDITERRQLEQELRQNLARYQALFESSSQLHYLLDTRAVIRALNPLAAERGQAVWGRSLSTGDSLWKRAKNPASIEIFRQQFAACLRGEWVQFEYAASHADGRITWYDVQFTPVYDSAGSIFEVSLNLLEITQRKGAEQALRRNEQRFRALFEQTNDAVFLIGLDRKYIVVNQQAADMLGADMEDFVGASATSFTDPAELEDAEQRWQMLQSGSRLPVYERTFIRKDGSRIYTEVILSLVRDSEGRPMHVQSVVRDITARKRAEEALRESENTFRTVIQTMQEGVWILDDAEKTLYVNQSLVEILGYSHQAMIGSLVSAYLNEESRTAIAPLFQPGQDKSIRHLDVCLVRADGSPVWALVSVTALRDASHQFGWLIMVTDISQRKQAEAALQQASSYNRGLIEASLDPMLTISPQGDITDVNVAAERITGYSRTRLIHTDFSGYFTDPDRAREAYRRAFEEGNVKDYELSIRHRDGRVRPVVFNAAVYRSEEGAVVGIFAAARDISDRKRVEETLRQSVAYNQALLNAVPDMILRLSKDGRYLDIKPAMNFPPLRPLDELYKLHVSEVLPAKQARAFMNAVARALATRKTQFLEYTLREHGEARSYESRTVPCSDDEVISIVRDITERKQVEISLRESEERFRTIFESAAVGIAVSDVSGYRMGVNPALQKMLGYSFEELYNMNFVQLTHPDDLPQELALIEELRAGKRDTYQIEKRYCRKDGSYFWVRLSASVIHDPDGGALHRLVLVEDITERRQAEEALRESEQRLRLILENMPVMLVAFNRQLQVLFWSHECERVTGYSAEDMIGNRRAFERLYPDPEERAHVMAMWQHHGDNYYDVEFPLQCKDGSIKNVSWSSISGQVPIPGWELWALGNDVTERKRAAQKEIELASERERVRIIANFIQDAAHEFRTPLSIINTSAYLLGHVDDTTTQTTHITKIAQQVTNITALVESLLTLSRLDTETNLHLRPLNVNDLITNAQVALEVQIQEKHHTVRLELDDTLPKIMGDSGKLHMALMNILYNAIRYTPPEGTITLRTSGDEHELAAEIEDTGVGIKPASPQLIFNRFYREDAAHTTPGFGLGLPIARKIVEQHGGRIEVTSTLGKGSRFRVILPKQQS